MSITGNRYKFGWSDPRYMMWPAETLRLRDNGDGTWSIVRVVAGESFGAVVVAKGLTRSVAEQMIKLAREE